MADKKSLTEIIVIPLVLAAVGTVSTLLITRYQALHTEEMARAQRDAAEIAANAQIESTERIARREQTLKLVEIFGANILKREPEARRLAVALLPSIDPELGRSLADAIAATDSNAAVRNAAANVRGRATEAEIDALIASFPGSDRRTAAQQLASMYEHGEPGVRRSIVDALVAAVVSEQEALSYRINIYVALTLSLLKPAWSATASQHAIIESLKNSRNYRDATFRLRVDQALANYSGSD